MKLWLMMVLFLITFNVYGNQEDVCKTLETVTLDSSLAAFAEVFKLMLEQENEISEEETKDLSFSFFEQSFKGKGVDKFYGQVLSDMSDDRGVLTAYVIASYSRAKCLDESLPKLTTLEKKLAYCNSAALRSSSSDKELMQEATYQCVINNI